MNLKSILLLLTLFQITSCVSTNKKSHVYSELDIKVKTALEAKVDVDMKKKLLNSKKILSFGKQTVIIRLKKIPN